jgi:hypothetical protein
VPTATSDESVVKWEIQLTEEENKQLRQLRERSQITLEKKRSLEA